MNCSFRYMLRQLIWPLFFIALAMAGVIWLTQSLRFVDLILNRGLPAHTFFYLAILVLPMVLPALIACVQLTTLILTGEPIGESFIWMRLLVVFNIIFTLLGATLTDFVLSS